MDATTQFASPLRSSPELLGAQAAALTSSASLQRVFDNCPFLLVVLNEHRQIVFCNRALAAAVGAANKAVLIGKRAGEVLGCIHAKKVPAGCGTSEACSTCGSLRAFLEAQRGREASKEWRITSLLNGKQQHFDFSVTCAPIEVGASRYFVFSLFDVSHEKRRRALERIFFHDVSNAAGGVQGMADLLMELVPRGEPAQIAEEIRSAAHALLSEIESQRQLAAAENNELTVLPTPLPTRELIERAASRYRAHPVCRGKEVRVAPDSLAEVIVSDAGMLDRVLGNMLKNALEAAIPGETVTIGCRAGERGFVEFWVHNPEAMPRKVQLQIFQRSFTTKGAGRGLGTYSMKLLTERYLGGSVSFRSDEATGTEFVARYPRSVS